MFQPTPKRCFTIESLVAKDSPLPASRSEDPIRPAALSYANSSPMNPFLNGFHSTGRGVYSNPDLVFAEAVSHPPNPAVPVHPVPPPHALAAHPLPASHSTHPLFASQQRDPSTFYPWLIHRYRYLGHRFQGTCNFSPLSFPALHPPAAPGRSLPCGCWGWAGGPRPERKARLGRARGLLSLSPPPPNLEELSEPRGLGLVLFCCFSRLVLVSREEGGKREGKAGWDFVSFLPSFKADEKVDIFCSGVLRTREEPPKEAARRAGNGEELGLSFSREGGGARRAAGPQEAPAATRARRCPC